MDPFTIAAIGILAWKRARDAERPKCKACGRAATHETECCKRTLCLEHLRAWQASPCPCRGAAY